jgi:signal transduction histidine kinase
LTLLKNADYSRQIVSIWEGDAEHEFDLTEVIQRELVSLQEEYPERTITTELPEVCVVRANPALPLAIEEAVVNAIEHNTADTTITVSVHTRDDGTTTIEIIDTGEGISHVDQEAIDLSKETALVHTVGLGLWMIYWVTETSGGSMEIDKNDPQGTIIRLILPQETNSCSDFVQQYLSE